VDRDAGCPVEFWRFADFGKSGGEVIVERFS